MATNPFFSVFSQENEQNLIDDLIVETIKQTGHDVYYLPRTGIKRDDILNEYSYSEFNDALPVEMWINNFSNFEGEGQLLSKFGLEVRDQMTLTVSVRSFEEFIQPTTNALRPEEGDCIYIPMLKVIYQIKYVDSTPIFYTLGKLNCYGLTCDLLEFSNEQFKTGLAEIDNINKPFQNVDTDNDYSLEEYDNNASNSVIQDESEDYLDFSEQSPFRVGEE